MTAGQALPSPTTNTKSWRPRCERSRSHQTPARQTLPRRRWRAVDGSRGRATLPPRSLRRRSSASPSASCSSCAIEPEAHDEGTIAVAGSHGRQSARAPSRTDPRLGLRARAAARRDPARRRATTTPALRPADRQTGPARPPAPTRTSTREDRRATPRPATTAARTRKRAAAAPSTNPAPRHFQPPPQAVD